MTTFTTAFTTASGLPLCPDCAKELLTSGARLLDLGSSAPTTGICASCGTRIDGGADDPAVLAAADFFRAENAAWALAPR